MFFLPNRLFSRRDELFVSFNLTVVPPDMDVTFMALHLPLPKLLTPTIVYVKEIIVGWSEESMKKGGIPSRSKTLQLLKCSPGQDELIIDVTAFQKKWRLMKKHNHGVSVRLINANVISIQNNPPYLVIETI